MFDPIYTASLRATAFILSLQILNLIPSTSAQFIYPAEGKPLADKYSDGDSANISWVSKYGDPYLQLYCGGFPPLTNQTVDTIGSKAVFFQTGKRDNCYFRLSDHFSYIASANFSIRESSGRAQSFNFSSRSQTTSTARATATSQSLTSTANTLSQTSLSITSSSTVPPSASATATVTATPPASGLSTGAKVGLGVGIPCGLIAIAGIAGLLWFLLRRRRSHQYQRGDPAAGAFDGQKAELDTNVGIEAPQPYAASKHGSTHDLADGPRLEQYELDSRAMNQQASVSELDAQSPSVATGGGLAPTGHQPPYRDIPRPRSDRISGLYD